MDVSVSDPSSKTRSPVLKEVRLCIFCSLAVSKPVGDDEDRDNDGVFNREHDKRRWGWGRGSKYMRDDHDGDDNHYCICITFVMMTKTDLPIVSVAVMTCIAPRSI